MEAKPRELILHLGLEGGVRSIVRSPSGDGGWEFFVDGETMIINLEGEEDSRSWTRGPFATIEEALSLVSRSGRWVLFYPLSIHPEYRDTIGALVADAARRLPRDLDRFWRLHAEHWRRLCGTSDLPQLGFDLDARP